MTIPNDGPPEEHDGWFGRTKHRLTQRAADTGEWAEGLRTRQPLVDAAFLVYERDRSAAGTVLGSAIAFRLFLFFIPCLVFGVGLVGLLSGWIEADSIASAGSITGALAEYIREAHDQTRGAAVVTTLTGLVLMISAGRSLAKSLVASSSLAWSSTGKVTARVRVIASITGLTSSVVLIGIINNRLNDDLGVAGHGLSFGAGLVLYVVVFLLLMASLPRGTSDPGALIPGAVTVALVVVGMQAVSQIYLPNRLSSASDLYGGIGVAVVALGWLFILGRTLSFTFSLNAALFDRFGSLSQAIFALPVLRLIPRKSSTLRAYFGLDEHGRSIATASEPDGAVAAFQTALDALRDGEEADSVVADSASGRGDDGTDG